MKKVALAFGTLFLVAGIVIGIIVFGLPRLGGGLQDPGAREVRDLSRLVREGCEDWDKPLDELIGVDIEKAELTLFGLDEGLRRLEAATGVASGEEPKGILEEIDDLVDEANKLTREIEGGSRPETFGGDGGEAFVDTFGNWRRGFTVRWNEMAKRVNGANPSDPDLPRFMAKLNGGGLPPEQQGAANLDQLQHLQAANAQACTQMVESAESFAAALDGYREAARVKSIAEMQQGLEEMAIAYKQKAQMGALYNEDIGALFNKEKGLMDDAIAEVKSVAKFNHQEIGEEARAWDSWAGPGCASEAGGPQFVECLRDEQTRSAGRLEAQVKRARRASSERRGELDRVVGALWPWMAVGLVAGFLVPIPWFRRYVTQEVYWIGVTGGSGRMSPLRILVLFVLPLALIVVLGYLGYSFVTMVGF